MGEINFVADLRVLKLKRVGELIFLLWSGGTCSCVRFVVVLVEIKVGKKSGGCLGLSC